MTRRLWVCFWKPSVYATVYFFASSLVTPSHSPDARYLPLSRGALIHPVLFQVQNMSPLFYFFLPTHPLSPDPQSRALTNVPR